MHLKSCVFGAFCTVIGHHHGSVPPETGSERDSHDLDLLSSHPDDRLGDGVSLAVEDSNNTKQD